MVFQPGHKLSVGNSGGRKTKLEEFKQALEKKEAEITEKVLLKLARRRVNEHIDKKLSFEKTAKMALPIVLKGMAEKNINVEMTLEQLLEKNLARKNRQD